MRAKDLVTRALCEAASLAAPGPKPGRRVLLYHSIAPPAAGDRIGLTVAPAAFAAQMRELRADPRLTTAALDAPAEPGCSVAVTLDDGYADSLTAAAPVLSALSIPFAVFVVAAFTGRERGYLDLAQLRELAAVPGCLIGSHGLEHRALRTLADDALREELSGSRRTLEDQLGRPVTTISYPYGSVDRRVRDAARAAGYALGVCSRTDVNGPDRDPLLLCRTEILTQDPPRLFRQKVYGAWDWHRLRHADPGAA